MRTRGLSGVGIAVLLLLGVWQAGHGAWIHAKAQLAQYLLQRAWTRTLEGERDARPWPWADTWPVARLRVPAHGVDLIVLDGVSGRTLAFAPGHGGPLPGMPGTAIDVRLKLQDIKESIAIFFLIFISTFPVVIPFVFIHDTKLALRISNLVAIVMMFFCGWSVAKYVGYNKWKMSISIILIGIMLVAVTIALGG